MWKLLKYLKKYRKEAVCAPLFKLLEASFELLVPLVVAKIIDVGIQNRDTGYIIRMCLLMAALGLTGLASAVTAQYFSAKAAVGFAAKLRHELFAHVQKLSFTEMDEIGTSTLITRMTSDVNQVQSGVNLFLRLFLRSPFIVFGAMIMAFTIDVKAALVFAGVIPVLCVIVFGIMLVSIPLYRRVQERLDRVVGVTRENLLGVRVIRSFRRENAETETFDAGNEALVKVQLFSGRISALMNPLTCVVINGGLILLLYVGGVRVDSGAITQGSVVALVNYISQILVELVKLANLIITVTKAIACGNRIGAVLETPAGMESALTSQTAGNGQEISAPGTSGSGQEISAPGTSGNGRNLSAPGTSGNGQEKSAFGISRKETDASEIAEQREGKASLNGQGQKTAPAAVSFEHVCLRYRGAAAEALTDLNFTVRKGETIGVIGGTGSGKSSLVNLIPRFYDATSGCVKVDGCDVRDYEIGELRRKIGIVMQKAVLFKGTIRSNLLWGNEQATEEDMKAAIHAAQADDVAFQAKNGLDTEVEQEGRNFSGGQKQRLTIARALVRRPEILILDDSASALDFATDARLRRAIADLSGNMTVFIVSQRTSSIMQADRIIVLEDGAVAGIGTHEELLAGCEVYQETYYSQFPKEDAKEEQP